MTYALSTWLVGNVAAGEAIDLVADAGFTQVELSAEWSQLVSAWEEEPAGVCARLDARGISVPSVHSPRKGRFLDLPDDGERRASVQDNIRYFGLMKACSIPEIIIHPVSGSTGNSSEAWALGAERSRESLEELAEAAGDARLRLAVENLGSGGRPGSTMESLLELIEGLGEHVGLCMDIGHSQQAQLDLLDELCTALSSRKLFTLHLHDVDPDGKDHYIPGEGCIDFLPFLSLLDEHDYDGGRTLEVAVASEDAVVERVQRTAAIRERWERL